MSDSIMIVLKQYHNSKVECLGHESSKSMAENKALLAYTERSAYMAAAIEINPQELFPYQRMNVIFKIERTCKCTNIQRVFNYAGGSSLAKCSRCELPFGQSALVNEQEVDTDLVEAEAV